jgi:predicted NodU family carbamoyl transferase
MTITFELKGKARQFIPTVTHIGKIVKIQVINENPKGHHSQPLVALYDLNRIEVLIYVLLHFHKAPINYILQARIDGIFFGQIGNLISNRYLLTLKSN